MKNSLFEFTVRVLRAEGCELPEPMQGALVPCYATAPDYQSAMKLGVEKLIQMNYIFDDIKGNVREIPILDWDGYIEKVWPDYVSHFPTRAELSARNSNNDQIVFFGPFAGF